MGYGTNTIFVDLLTNHIHLVPSKGMNTTTGVAKCLFNYVLRQHGLPGSIVSNREPEFAIIFRTHLMQYCAVQIIMWTSQHP